MQCLQTTGQTDLRPVEVNLTELCGDCGYAPEEDIETESWE